MTTKGHERGDWSNRTSVPQDEPLALFDAGFSSPASEGRAAGRKAKGVTQTQIVEVFTAWQESTGRLRTKLDDSRKLKIRLALESYPVDDVLDAVRGWRMSPFHRGENREHKVWNELTLLLRNSEKIEHFRDLARSEPWMRNELGQRTPRQQASDVRRRIALGEA